MPTWNSGKHGLLCSHLRPCTRNFCPTVPAFRQPLWTVFHQSASFPLFFFKRHSPFHTIKPLMILFTFFKRIRGTWQWHTTAGTWQTFQLVAWLRNTCISVTCPYFMTKKVIQRVMVIDPLTGRDHVTLSRSRTKPLLQGQFRRWPRRTKWCNMQTEVEDCRTHAWKVTKKVFPWWLMYLLHPLYN